MKARVSLKYFVTDCSLMQDMFLHATLVGHCNDNIRHELRVLPKNTTALDENILESLDFAAADELVIVCHNGSTSLQYMSMDTANLAFDCVIVHLTGHK